LPSVTNCNEPGSVVASETKDDYGRTLPFARGRRADFQPPLPEVVY